MFELPAPLHVGLRNLLHQHPSAHWKHAAQQLSDRYRGPRGGEALVQSEIDALAYSAMLLPATYAQISGALRMLPPYLTTHWQSLLDIGSGPATALWALMQFTPTCTQYTAVEVNTHFVAMAQHLSRDLPLKKTFIQQDIVQAPPWEPHDVVVIAHVLNELTPAQRQRVIANAWAATRQVLIIIEPGIPAFMPIITQAREQLITAGGWVAAPCTHHHPCPWGEGSTAEWCHFGQKITRPDFQRQARAAELGWEEAKFSFVAVSKQAIDQSGARLVHDPVRHKGYIDIPLCSAQGIGQHRILKRQHDAFRAVRHVRWGDWIPLLSPDTENTTP